MATKKKILLIEDEESLRSVMRIALEERGFEVIIAIDGEEGIAAIRAGTANLVLLDVILPKMDGYEILKTLTLKEKKQAPIIIFSVSTEPLSRKKLRELGVADWIMKSEITPDQVIDKINQYTT
ncbi:hypothetical protein CL632_01330 [bacterium]|jgi:two-component system alkaline phosphatase synthesis response regulator PhoP|nr:hypothetical protein [bacterium]MDP6571661.1 response regulator [Patescibacteria group bacterium]|tara:strand:+ start:3966 stop:4337 length:372 start_codon:yes stop_codon:yes gene_type:complete